MSTLDPNHCPNSPDGKHKTRTGERPVVADGHALGVLFHCHYCGAAGIIHLKKIDETSIAWEAIPPTPITKETNL